MKAIVMAAILAAAPAAAQTQAQLNARAAAAWRRADAAMTVEWRRSYAAMKARDAAYTSRGGGFGHAAALLASQRAWLAFRDAQCVVEGGGFAGGSMQAMVVADCRTRLTDERGAQLRRVRQAR